MRRALLLSVYVVVLVVVCCASLAFGSRDVGIAQVLAALFAPADGNADHVAIRELRIPRTIIGVVAGLALGLAGALMQGLSRNPLADPGLLGINAGASLAVVVAITWWGVVAPASFVWFAIGGATLAAALTYGIASGRKRLASPVALTIAGSAVTAIFTSLITLVLITDLETLNQFRLWSVGSLSGRGLDAVAPVVPLVILGAALAAAIGPTLNILALGSDLARGLGQRVGFARAICAIAIVLLCASATAIAGPIAFIGLVVPHFARAVCGSDYRWVLAFSAVIGPSLLLAADILGRLVVPPGELEAGIVVAFVGAPVLIYFVRRSKVSVL